MKTPIPRLGTLDQPGLVVVAEGDLLALEAAYEEQLALRDSGEPCQTPHDMRPSHFHHQGNRCWYTCTACRETYRRYQTVPGYALPSKGNATG